MKAFWRPVCKENPTYDGNLGCKIFDHPGVVTPLGIGKNLKESVEMYTATLTVGVLEDTKCSPADLNAWGKFFLPVTVQMQVVGYVEGTPYPCDQLVLMTCEDKKFYGYDGDELHLVASSLEDLCSEGIDYPASKSFYRGEAFKDTPTEEWEELMKSPVGKKLDQEHHQLVSKHKDSFLKNLRIGAEKRRWVSNPTTISSLYFNQTRFFFFMGSYKHTFLQVFVCDFKKIN
uniref:Uncharacterized protein n=1 Tax=Oryzias melastigma TaxID=30732 RepID=A0A3B3DD33_ORYME